MSRFLAGNRWVEIMLIWMRSPGASTKHFVFLDRDGVLNENRVDYVKSTGEVILYEDALEALAHLHQQSISAILVSNQSGISRGLITWENFWKMHDGIIQCTDDYGGNILAALYCPHHPDELCGCRKPHPTMILAVCRIYGIRPESTAFIGDSETDMLAASAAGCKGIRIHRSTYRDDAGEGRLDTPEFSNLVDAVLSLYA